MNPEAVIIGLTGSFGSGCSILGGILQKRHGFKEFKLSDEVRSEAGKQNIGSPVRAQLQAIGSEMRRQNGNSWLSKKIIDKMEACEDSRFVIDGFRHPAEVQEFRKYPNFFLIAIDASTSIRWDRVKSRYGGNQTNFENDDRKDRDEGLSYGQQVLHCVEQADVVFLNEEQYPNRPTIEDRIKERFEPQLKLLTGEQLRQPTSDETMMTVASSLALQSSCIKRRVGAVLCNERGFIVSAAFNEVPGTEGGCLSSYRMCYRDFYREKFRVQVLEVLRYCPSCGEKLKGDEGDCIHCGKDLKGLLPPDFKVLDKCRALHAEEAVLLQTPPAETKSAILYTTTFPCMQCAKRIVHTKIGRVIFIDPYPNSESVGILMNGGITAKKFEGIKAPVFYRLYHRQRELIEKAVEEAAHQNERR